MPDHICLRPAVDLSVQGDHGGFGLLVVDIITKVLSQYRVTHLLADLGWVDRLWNVPLSCLGSTAAAVQPDGLWNIPN